MPTTRTASRRSPIRRRARKPPDRRAARAAPDRARRRRVRRPAPHGPRAARRRGRRRRPALPGRPACMDDRARRHYHEPMPVYPQLDRGATRSRPSPGMVSSGSASSCSAWPPPPGSTWRRDTAVRLRRRRLGPAPAVPRRPPRHGSRRALSVARPPFRRRVQRHARQFGRRQPLAGRARRRRGPAHCRAVRRSAGGVTAAAARPAPCPAGTRRPARAPHPGGAHPHVPRRRAGAGGGALPRAVRVEARVRRPAALPGRSRLPGGEPATASTTSGITGARLPRHPVVLSFDDGYRQDFSVVAPLLHELRWPAVLNLIVRNTRPGQDLTPVYVRALIARRLGDRLAHREPRRPDHALGGTAAVRARRLAARPAPRVRRARELLLLSVGLV